MGINSYYFIHICLTLFKQYIKQFTSEYHFTNFYDIYNAF